MTFCWSSDGPGVLVTFDDEEFLAVCFFFGGVGAGDLLVKYDLARCTSTVMSFFQLFVQDDLPLPPDTRPDPDLAVGSLG